MSVSDDGQGVPSTEVEHLFFAEHPRAHAGAYAGGCKDCSGARFSWRWLSTAKQVGRPVLKLKLNIASRELV